MHLVLSRGKAYNIIECVIVSKNEFWGKSARYGEKRDAQNGEWTDITTKKYDIRLAKRKNIRFRGIVDFKY